MIKQAPLASSVVSFKDQQTRDVSLCTTAVWGNEQGTNRMCLSRLFRSYFLPSGSMYCWHRDWHSLATTTEQRADPTPPWRWKHWEGCQKEHDGKNRQSQTVSYMVVFFGMIWSECVNTPPVVNWINQKRFCFVWKWKFSNLIRPPNHSCSELEDVAHLIQQ